MQVFKSIVKKKTFFALCAVSAAIYASPALATSVTPASDPCSIASVQGVDFVGNSTGGAIACQGYYSNNLLSGSNVAAQQTALTALLSTTPTSPNPQTGYTPSAFSWNGDWNALVNAANPFFVLDSDGTTANPGLTNGILDFGQALMGQTVIGAHFGAFPDSNAPNVTAFWLFNFTAPTKGIQLLDPEGNPTVTGFSNAALYQTGTAAVPEPASWAMMLVGFGGIGAAMRRRRQPALAQIA